MSDEIKISVNLPRFLGVKLEWALTQWSNDVRIRVNVERICGGKSVLIITAPQKNRDGILSVIGGFAKRHGLDCKGVETTPA